MNWKLIISIAFVVLVLGYGFSSLTHEKNIEVENSELSLDVNSVAQKNTGISSFHEISECQPGKGTLMKPREAAGPQLITVSDKIVGIRTHNTPSSLWSRNDSVYFQELSEDEGCAPSNWNYTVTPDSLLVSEFKEKLDLRLESNGSRICEPGIGKVWSSEDIDWDLLGFEDSILGFRSNEATIFLKDPPTRLECAKRTYLEDNQNISGTMAWDLYKGKDKRRFYARAKSCQEWYKYEGLSSLNCNYTDKGIDDVSLVADPANFIQAPMSDQEFSTSRVSNSLGNSWDMEFISEKEIILTNQNGEVSILDAETGEVRQIKSLDVLSDSAAGLMGVEIDPDFDENGKIYLYYSYEYTDPPYEYTPPYVIADEKHLNSRISSFTLENGQLENETVLLDSILGHNWHAGGRLEFGPDEKLYATTGEASSWKESPYQAQDPNSLRGKILRMNRDGSVPSDNPFNDSLVYSTGHRNPQGLAWQPETQTLYNTEHGPWRHDEINKVQPGKNYGWGRLKCDEVRMENIPERGDAESPVFCAKNWTLAPSGATFVNDTESPWHGDLFIAGLRSKHLHRFSLSNSSLESHEVFYIADDVPVNRRVRGVEYHNGSLWALGDRGWLTRIDPN